jgi:cold shock CspA family protein
MSNMDFRRAVGYATGSTLEALNGARHGEVVQFAKGIWVHLAAERRDVFVHISAVEKAGLPSLNEGQIVEYEESSSRGKASAEKGPALTVGGESAASTCREHAIACQARALLTHGVPAS